MYASPEPLPFRRPRPLPHRLPPRTGVVPRERVIVAGEQPVRPAPAPARSPRLRYR
ncbi:hypothetical protein O0235_12410 [Tepidiforma flava]|uniref:Uncharacterized protein n=1 Tax=Tepidiforma flava TaxID=3004094 RepID=A0ABY7M6B2_9CHLR|nr:hypothetical protein [Tepidiforma flava]WBL35569.1 hypothetical protein O0235_12410 [Tepidiforma flava]